MNIQPIHPDFEMPVKASDNAGAYDLFMPVRGSVNQQDKEGTFIGLGFKAAVPEGHVALLVPRSGKGAKGGLSLNNTVGVIDPDYRGEWKVCLRGRNKAPFKWEAGDRIVQMLIVPTSQVELNQVESLDETERGDGGFGSTGE